MIISKLSRGDRFVTSFTNRKGIVSGESHSAMYVLFDTPTHQYKPDELKSDDPNNVAISKHTEVEVL